VQAEVRDRLTDEILFGALEHGGTVHIGLADDALTFTFEPAAPAAVPPAAAVTA
jgi:ATP-dependent Clp protease ATP-binding subunit ClpA